MSSRIGLACRSPWLSHQPSGGWRVCASRSRSGRRGRRGGRSASLRRAPPSMRPSGRPSGEKPHGTDALGMRARLKTRVSFSSASRDVISTPVEVERVLVGERRRGGDAGHRDEVDTRERPARPPAHTRRAPAAPARRPSPERRNRTRSGGVSPWVHAVAVAEHARAVCHRGLGGRDAGGDRGRPVQLGQRYLHHLRAEPFQRAHRGLERECDVRVDRVPDVLQGHSRCGARSRRPPARRDVVDLRGGDPRRGRARRGPRGRSGAGRGPRRCAPSGRRCRASARAGVTPKRLTSPNVGLIPEMPQSDDGMRMEPPVSEPRPKGKKPDATP